MCNVMHETIQLLHVSVFETRSLPEQCRKGSYMQGRLGDIEKEK